MIKLTKIHGEEIIVNSSNIQWIEASPDTTLTFLNGVKVIVREKTEEIIRMMDPNNKLAENSTSCAPSK